MKLNCPNCGAPIDGYKCSYCGTVFHDFTDISFGEPVYLRISHNGQPQMFKAYVTDVTVNYMPDSITIGRLEDGRISRVVTNTCPSIDVGFQVIT